MDGMVDMKAINRQRYREKIAQLKAKGEYETFKKHKDCGKDCGKAMLSQYVRRPMGRSVPEKSSVSKSLEKKMVREGTFEEYWR